VIPQDHKIPGSSVDGRWMDGQGFDLVDGGHRGESMAVLPERVGV